MTGLVEIVFCFVKQMKTTLNFQNLLRTMENWCGGNIKNTKTSWSVIIEIQDLGRSTSVLNFNERPTIRFLSYIYKNNILHCYAFFR